jgi:hypothetical protein
MTTLRQLYLARSAERAERRQRRWVYAGLAAAWCGAVIALAYVLHVVLGPAPVRW